MTGALVAHGKGFGGMTGALVAHGEGFGGGAATGALEGQGVGVAVGMAVMAGRAVSRLCGRLRHFFLAGTDKLLERHFFFPSPLTIEASSRIASSFMGKLLVAGSG